MDKKTVGSRRSNILGSTFDNKDSIEYLIESPIRCGFLLVNIIYLFLAFTKSFFVSGQLFCDSQFNSENLDFVMEVDSYRDALLLPEMNNTVIWTKRWRQIDAEIKNKSEEELEIENQFWPTNLPTTKSFIEAKIKHICDTYLDNDAIKEICTSSVVRENTLRRAKLFGIYGPEVFMEAIIDPIKTLRRDILPRFLTSDLFIKMSKQIQSCTPLPAASTLEAPAPTTSFIDNISVDDIPIDRLFTLPEVISCKYMYEEFLGYLYQRVCSENLLCVRMVEIFKERISYGDTQGAEEEAWTIYRYFVASGSAFEVSIGYTARKYLMRSLASPRLNTFDDIYKSAYHMLTANFSQFQQQEQYLQLATLLRNKKILSDKSVRLRKVRSTVASSLSCFGIEFST